jgi:hypothetical protein
MRAFKLVKLLDETRFLISVDVYRSRWCHIVTISEQTDPAVIKVPSLQARVPESYSTQELFSAGRRLQTGFRTHPAFCPVDTRAYFT